MEGTVARTEKVNARLPQISGRGIRQAGVITVTLVLVLAGLVASVALGAVPLSPGQIVSGLFDSSDRVAHQIVWNLRVPRVMVAGLVGMNLAMSGVLLQGIMRNPLAAPAIVGVTAGAGLAATAVMVLFSGLPTFLPLAAFGGAMSASVVVYLLSWQPGLGTSPVRMVLAGWLSPP